MVIEWKSWARASHILFVLSNFFADATWHRGMNIKNLTPTMTRGWQLDNWRAWNNQLMNGTNPCWWPKCCWFNHKIYPIWSNLASFLRTNKSRVENIPCVMFVLRPRRNILGAQLSVDCRSRHNLSLYISATYREYATQVWKKILFAFVGTRLLRWAQIVVG